MKTLAFVLLLIAVSCTSSQNGKIAIKNPASDPEERTTFLYKAPHGLDLPEDVQVNVCCSDFRKKTFQLEKKGSGYEFSMKLPAESTVLFFAVSDSKQNMIDNNSGKGYVLYLKDPSEEGYEHALLEKIQYSGMAGYFLELDYTEQDMLDEYESVFASYPYLKNESEYASYLHVKFQINKEETRPELIDFANKMAAKDDEESLTAAHGIYRSLNMNDELKEVKKVALEKYPKGSIARSNFMDEYFSVQEPDEKFIAEKIDEYLKLFGDPKESELDILYFQLLSLYMENRDTLSMEKYKDQITDKNLWISIYNGYAWKASGMDLTSPGKNLDFAAQISRKSLDLVEYLMDHPDENEAGYDMEERHRMCADTYALILYKLKMYDRAFQYQHEIVEVLGDEMYADGKERYAAFAEKAKGPEYAKVYLEEQLREGTDSKVMVEQLQRIYTQLNISEYDFEQLIELHEESTAQKDREEIIEKYGEIKAMDFTLTNLEGEKVTLSDYKGSVVLLDFWATWCGPCIFSFPKMQEMVNQFEDDNVEFFFVNSWENQEPDKVREQVLELMEEKGYNFNVLFDFNDEVITEYKIQGIPSRILIDKKGNIKSIVGFNDDLAAMINESL